MGHAVVETPIAAARALLLHSQGFSLLPSSSIIQVILTIFFIKLESVRDIQVFIGFANSYQRTHQLAQTRLWLSMMRLMMVVVERSKHWLIPEKLENLQRPEFWPMDSSSLLF